MARTEYTKHRAEVHPRVLLRRLGRGSVLADVQVVDRKRCMSGKLIYIFNRSDKVCIKWHNGIEEINKLDEYKVYCNLETI